MRRSSSAPSNLASAFHFDGHMNMYRPKKIDWIGLQSLILLFIAPIYPLNVSTDEDGGDQLDPAC